MRLRLAFLFFVFTTLFGFSLAVQVAHACTNPSEIPSGFAAPCPVFSVTPTSTTQSGSVTVTATPGANGYIDQQFYLYNGSTWMPYLFQGSFVNEYSTSTGSYTLNSAILGSLPTGTIYLAEWDWIYSAAQSCFIGPSSTVCDQGDWRVQEFTLTGGGVGQQTCQLPATGPLQYSLTDTGQPQPGELPLIGYLAQDLYRALPGMPTPPTSFCGPLWQPNYPYVNGNMIEPLPLGAVFQAVTNPRCIASCKSGANQPTGFVGTLYLSSPVAPYISNCSDTGTTATCDTVDLYGVPGGVNSGEPYKGADIGSTFVIQNYINPAYDGAWVVTGSTGASPYTVSFTASGLGSGTCSNGYYAGTANCVGYQRGTQVTDGSIIWQYLGPQNEEQ